jgi:hypothetical protein
MRDWNALTGNAIEALDAGHKDDENPHGQLLRL